jgi:methionyl-tRNA formyltransferase
MRVVFFGTPAFAAPTLAALVASRHDVVGVVTQPDRARGRGQAVTFAPVKALAMAHGIPVAQRITLTDASAIDSIRAFNAEMGVVASYGKILP